MNLREILQIRIMKLLTTLVLWSFVSVVLLSVIPLDLQLKWWLEDLPIMSGQLKLIFYVLMYVLCASAFIARPPTGDSPLQAPDMWELLTKEWVTPAGIARYLLAPMNWQANDRSNVQVLKALRTVLLVSWLFSAVGLFGRIAPTITGLIFFFFHGVVFSMVGTNHRWYVVMYCLLFMGLCETSNWSLDAYLYNITGHNWPFYNPTPLVLSPLVRKLQIISGLYTLFAGGVAKLLNSGLDWGKNGNTLQFYTSKAHRGGWHVFRDLVSNNWLVCTLLASGSLVLEILSPLAFFNEIARHVIIVSAIGMHFGIWLTMHPNYLPQSVSYMMGVNWNLETTNHINPQDASSLGFFCLAATFFTLFLVGVAFTRLETWPFTGIPMYSYNRIGFKNNSLLTEKQLKTCVFEYMNSPYPYPLCWGSGWTELRLEFTNSNGIRETAHPLDLVDKSKSNIGEKTGKYRNSAIDKQWNHLVKKVIACSLSEIYKNTDSILTDPKPKSITASQFLSKISEYLIENSTIIRESNIHPELQLIVHFSSEKYILASSSISTQAHKYADKSSQNELIGEWVNNLSRASFDS
eukprot:TRINITY_DN3388_c0_g2_i1.p1 TRINITY_DN3388_c0_g2~~TRINITY_DN3388_c0_g2_i1.p1  ORF type:complete len:577 (+),score=83.03 TRINITY_DN3388_c0_g2_i1:96-1826(+)